jgi:hypothetical protein
VKGPEGQAASAVRVDFSIKILKVREPFDGETMWLTGRRFSFVARLFQPSGDRARFPAISYRSRWIRAFDRISRKALFCWLRSHLSTLATGTAFR